MAPMRSTRGTGPVPRVLRIGAIGVDRLREVVPDVTD